MVKYNVISICVICKIALNYQENRRILSVNRDIFAFIQNPL